MRFSYVAGLAFAGLALSACSGSPVVKDRAVTVNMPVAQPCAGERPSPPVPLSRIFPQWDGFDVRQKAAAVGKQALEWQTYGEQLHAATAACP